MPLERGGSNIPEVFNGGHPIQLLCLYRFGSLNFFHKKAKVDGTKICFSKMRAQQTNWSRPPFGLGLFMPIPLVLAGGCV